MAIDRKTYTDRDWAAIREKHDKPGSTVICPRCGEELNRTELSSGILVQCKTEGCIFGGTYGI